MKNNSINTSSNQWLSIWPLWVDHMGLLGDWPRREFLDTTICKLLNRIQDIHILDAGCGEGRLSRLLAKHGGLVTAIDIVPELVSIAQKISSGEVDGELLSRWPWFKHYTEKNKIDVIYEVADLAKLPSKYNEKYEVVVCSCVLNDIGILDEAVASIARVLKEKGTCILVLPNPNIVKPNSDTLSSDVFEDVIEFEEIISQTLRVTNYYRTLPTLLNAFGKRKLLLDRMVEPLLSQQAAAKYKNEISTLCHLRNLPNPCSCAWFTVLRFYKVIL